MYLSAVRLLSPLPALAARVPLPPSSLLNNIAMASLLTQNHYAVQESGLVVGKGRSHLANEVLQTSLALPLPLFCILQNFHVRLESSRSRSLRLFCIKSNYISLRKEA